MVTANTLNEYTDDHANMMFTPIQIGAAIKILESSAFINELIGFEIFGVKTD